LISHRNIASFRKRWLRSMYHPSSGSIFQSSKVSAFQQKSLATRWTYLFDRWQFVLAKIAIDIPHRQFAEPMHHLTFSFIHVSLCHFFYSSDAQNLWAHLRQDEASKPTTNPCKTQIRKSEGCVCLNASRKLIFWWLVNEKSFTIKENMLV